MPTTPTCLETTGLVISGLWLVYPNTPIGDSIVSWKTTPRRATEINIRQNFWSNRVSLDGRYPAIYYLHEFVIFMEKESPALYVQGYFDYIPTLVGSQPVALTLRSQNSGQDVVAFGNCLIEPPEQNTPEELFFYKAGFIKLQFKGTELPSVCTANSLV